MAVFSICDVPSSVLDISKSTEAKVCNMATVLKEVKYSQGNTIVYDNKTTTEHHNLPCNSVKKNVG